MSCLVSFCSCVFRSFWCCSCLAWGGGDWSWCFSCVWFVIVWIYRFPLPLGVWEMLRFVIVALPGLFSYLFFFRRILRCWARKWGIRFQPVKCNIMYITRKRTNKIKASYTLEGMVLKNLGVTITHDLFVLVLHFMHLWLIIIIVLLQNHVSSPFWRK